MPLGPRTQLPFVSARCAAAAEVWKASTSPKPKILCLSGGTAHCPQLLDARGSVIFEATASAAECVDRGVPAEDVFARGPRRKRAGFRKTGSAASPRRR